MTDTLATPPEDDDVALAAEYVLRLLSPAEEREVRNRAENDPNLTRLIQDWESQLVQMADEVASISPNPRVRQRLMDVLFEPAPKQSFWDKLGLWPVVAAAVVVGSVATFLVVQPLLGRSADLVATLSAPNGELTLSAEYYVADRSIAINLDNGAVRAGRVLQIWGIVNGGRPVSIGVLPPSGEGVFIVPDALFGRLAGMRCVVSEELPGGSPTGQPTGPILASGFVRES